MLLVEFYNFFSIVWVLSLLLWSLNNWITDWPTQRTTWKLGLYASIQLLQQWAGDCHYFTLNISSFLGPELNEHLNHLFVAGSRAQRVHQLSPWLPNKLTHPPNLPKTRPTFTVPKTFAEVPKTHPGPRLLPAASSADETFFKAFAAL